eukprot:UN03883
MISQADTEITEYNFQQPAFGTDSSLTTAERDIQKEIERLMAQQQAFNKGNSNIDDFVSSPQRVSEDTIAMDVKALKGLGQISMIDLHKVKSIKET